MSTFSILLALVCAICIAGLIRRYARHRARLFAPPGKTRAESAQTAHNPPPGLAGRMGRAARSAARSLAAAVTDVLLLWRTARTSPYRWLAHTLILSGFTGLLVFHALDDIISYPYIAGYESTLDPWQWLRNLFGAMVLCGAGLAVLRRLRTPALRRLSRVQDWLLLAAVAGIVGSGFALEAVKIISPHVFTRMTDEYFLPQDETELAALRAYWSTVNGVIFTPPASTDPALLEQGAQLNENNCVYCHAETASAFVSRALATAVSPAAAPLNNARADQLLWYLHVGLALLALACMPYGKFLHPIATPLNLVARQGSRNAAGPADIPADIPTDTPPDIPTKAPAAATASPPSPVSPPSPSGAQRRLGLEACTRCGECSLHCSVAPAYTVVGNPNILPSEKLLSLRRYTEGSLLPAATDAFAEGSRICTECLRCTDICPSGINLQDLWLASKSSLKKEELDGPNTTIRQCSAAQWANVLGAQGKSRFEQEKGDGLADRAESFWGCVQCTTCTSVCPVVAVCEAPAKDLDLMPQQIMNLLRMGLKDEALGVRMVWSCTTCYKCQEHCPQDVPVADILFELRQIATERFKERRLTSCPLPAVSPVRIPPVDGGTGPTGPTMATTSTAATVATAATVTNPGTALEPNTAPAAHTGTSDPSTGTPA
ncbi:4Fe-4S dicluster domain-containing protein [Desulfovibrio psychrotolerans]|uniref:4Fe-4S dicluster domain-containing protein n=1 Tax=Desulfovibrio psychrotolerans TaxID=415242 RepID=A0A7J0BUF1_9BACT|nr:4Fe-4S dicluster domain-containing protein [Desulfovibrio psychrotolerans]GFM37339.1 hypothetical protein DSM19430T_20230 [Desulfovibrio psychrotolerans]